MFKIVLPGLKWTASYDDANTFNPLFGFSQDTSYNSYAFTMDVSGAATLLKYDSSGILQYSRNVFLPGGNPVQCTDKSGNTIIACGKNSTSDFFMTTMSTLGVQGPTNTQSSTTDYVAANSIEIMPAKQLLEDTYKTVRLLICSYRIIVTREPKTGRKL
jgi:hypothetical protein